MSVSVGDHVQMLKSKEMGSYDTIYEKRDWLYINDTNQSYEQSTSVIETASLSNSGKYVDYNKGYLSVPLLITLTGAFDDFDVAIKQSFLSMVNSITVDLNGTNLVQQNNLIDIVNHFKLLTTESEVTSHRWASIGFAKTQDVGSSYLQLGELGTDVLDKTELSKLHQSHVSKNETDVAQISVRAIIMLKDLHPVFASMPIAKGLNFKIQIFWNSTSCEFATDGAGVKTFRNTYKAYNGSNPLWCNPGVISGANAKSVVSVYVGDKCYNSEQDAVASKGAVGTQVQLWLPAVQMRESIEQDYLSSNAMKMVKYMDYYQYTINGVQAGETFNKLVSNGVSNLKAVLVVPMSATGRQHQSPLDDGRPQPYGHINNFQVLVGGSNVLGNDMRYSFHAFLQEFINSHGVNGNESPGVGSGLIGFRDWFQRPYYFVDCSRVPEEVSKAYRSLQITGTNVTKLAVDYLVYAFYERSFELNTVSGEISPAMLLCKWL